MMRSCAALLLCAVAHAQPDATASTPCDNPSGNGDCGSCQATAKGDSVEDHIDAAKDTYELTKTCLKKALKDTEKDNKKAYGDDKQKLRAEEDNWKSSAKYKEKQMKHYSHLSTKETWHREWQVLEKQYHDDKNGALDKLYSEDHKAYISYKKHVQDAYNEYASVVSGDNNGGETGVQPLGVRAALMSGSEYIPQPTSKAAIAFLCASVVALVVVVAEVAMRPKRRDGAEAEPLLR